MQRVEAKIRAVVADLAHAVRVGEHAARRVGLHGVVVPTAFPQLVDHLHIFLGDGVAVVVGGLAFASGAFGGAVEIAGDDVPADAPVGQVIQRRHAPGEAIGRLVGEIHGDAEAEMRGRRRHRGDQQQRIVDRRLRGVGQRRARVAAEHIVDAEHVGEEQAVEQAALEDVRPARSSSRGACSRANDRADGATGPAIDAPRSSSRRR